ncbi:hypothetical protein [Streptomyces sp. NPDC002640]
MAGSLLLGAAGCGGDGEPEGGQKTPKDYKVVAGTELCGGNAISADASRALKVITGESRFEASGERYTVERAAADLVDAFGTPDVWEGDACRVYTPLGTSDFELRITWTWLDGLPKGKPAQKFTLLKMGEETGAAANEAYVLFECRSDKLAGSSTAAHLMISAEHRTVSEPEDNVEALRDAYATVAHSFSLAMAKELGCEENGGLPEEAVLERA